MQRSQSDATRHVRPVCTQLIVAPYDALLDTTGISASCAPWTNIRYTVMGLDTSMVPLTCLLLFPGYMTSTMIKFVLILSEKHGIQETDLREFFQGVHAAFVENVMNPLVAVDSLRIESPRFDAKVEKHVAVLEKPAPAPSSRP